MYQAVPPPETENADSSKTVKEDSDDDPPSGVAQATWDKFMELKKRREKICKKASEKRVKDLKKKATNPVFEELQSTEDQSILRECEVRLPSSFKKKAITSDSEKTDNSSELRRKIPVSLQSNRCGQSSERKEEKSFKVNYKQEIDNAIKDGEFRKAEQLSDKMQQQDHKEKVKGILEAKEFAKRKFEQQEMAKKRKKKKLHWGFEQKERWESKGNM